MKQFMMLLLTVNILLMITACEINPTSSGDAQYNDAQTRTTASNAMDANTGDHEESGDYSWDSASATNIALSGDAIAVSGSGVTVDGSIATITSGGNYMISGTLNNGRIIVASEDGQIVRLILNNANITSMTNAPISINSAEKAVIILADNSSNTITDPNTYVFDNSGDDEPNAAIFSHDNLSIAGNGALTVQANYNDGIASKGGLVIHSGTMYVNAVDDGIRGKDYLVVKTGAITVNSGGDALKSDNDEDEEKGYILIENGDLHITSDADGFDAETDVLITNGVFRVNTGGGSSVTPGENSAKGIKGAKLVVIDNGTFNIDASDDAIHSKSGLVINAGTYTIASGDDAIHADASLAINEGTINVETCVEGIESNVIVINAGNINVVASDDSMNSTAGTDVESDDGSCTYIYGGYIVLTAINGDGLDSNGSIVMTGGTVMIHGPSNQPEVMYDYNGTFMISGGFFVASGSSSPMTQSLSSNSTQNSVTIIFNSPLGASTIFHIADSAGNDIVTFQPIHAYQSITFSSPELVNGNTYTIYTGGIAYTTFTVSDTLTVIQNR